MKKILSSILFGFLAVGLGFAQQPVQPLGSSFDVGIFYSPNYNYGVVSPVSGLKVSLGNSATGSASVTLFYGYIILPDGRKVYPFTNVATLPSITIDSGTQLETVTVTAASCSTPEILNTCILTATFSFTHGNGVLVTSGDQGIQEAINDASGAGGGAVYWVLDGGSTTLSTVAASTNVGTLTIPVHSIVLGAVGRVQTTITGCTGGWSLGFSSGTEFTPVNTTLTAGTTTDTTATLALTLPYIYNSAATIPIVHCTTANATAGVVHARIWGVKQAAPAY